MAAPTYIPIVLDESTAADGEAAQILSFQNATPTDIAKATNSTARPGRKGRMRLSFLLQYTTTAAPENALILVVRSPFADDVGQQCNRPQVLISPCTATAYTHVLFAAPTGGVPGAAAPATAADFAATFNSKTIPNWSITITAGTPTAAAAACYVTVLFGASAAN